MTISCKPLGFLLGSLFLLPLIQNACLAWDKDSHGLLTLVSAGLSVMDSGRGDCLGKIGLDGGLDHELVWLKKATVKEWLQEGSKLEDDAPRFNNHFHNPLLDWGTAGLDDRCLGIPVSGESALLWAQDGYGQENTAEGDWSWGKTREHYYEALTAPDDETRQARFACTFKGLGHQMHLVQDMAVPAHVRNDAHPLDALIHKNRYGGLFFESWAEKHPEILADFAKRPCFPEIGLNDEVLHGGAPCTPITRLTDIDSFTGINPPGVNSLITGLSEYTNANFFSDDTLFAAESHPPGHQHHFPFPTREDTNLQAFIDERLLPEIDVQSGETTFHISRVDGNGAKLIDHFVQPTYYTDNMTVFPLYFKTFYLSERCHEDAARFLVPRAVGYSARLPDYFFRGEMDLVRDEKEPGAYVIVNGTPGETMEGTFEIFYDRRDGKRMKLQEASFSIESGAGSDHSVKFEEPEDAREPGTYFVVFRGLLGYEKNAVAGVKSRPRISGGPCAIGENKNGCLGLGLGYAVTTSKGQGATESSLYDIRWKYVVVTPPATPDTEINWCYDRLSGLRSCYRYSTRRQDGGYNAYYELDEGSLPPSFMKGGKEFVYRGRDIYGRYRYTHQYGAVSRTLSWPVVTAYRPIRHIEETCIKASSRNGVSFLLTAGGTLYCCGGNTYGELGIGKAAGYTMVGEYPLPNFLTTSFIQVPGKWKDITITENYSARALDQDGRLWVTGHGGGGFNLEGGGTIATFTRYGNESPGGDDETEWLCISGTFLVKETSDAYEIHRGGYWLGFDGIECCMIIPKADWAVMAGGVSPREWTWAGEGGYGDGTIFTFLGGSCRDPGFGTASVKETGTLWSVQGSHPPHRETSGRWRFTAGAPVREEMNGSLKEIIGGQGIAITSPDPVPALSSHVRD